MHRLTTLLLLAWISLASPRFCIGQLTVLSSGNVNLQWRSSQLELIEQQLSDSQIKGSLRNELESQKQWLSSWTAGSISESSLFKQDNSSLVKRDDVDRLITEPAIDPNGLATQLRKRLLGKNARPTIKDTQSLHQALKAHPNDIGLRQLQLHWLDQEQYRKDYAADIAEAARNLAAAIAELEPQDEQLKVAQAYCHYRCARALAYRELPAVVAKKPIADPQLHESQLLSAYGQMVELLGKGRPEFILIEVRMLKRDHWYGQALMLLEKNSGTIDSKWFLKKRRDLLRDLGWNAPAQEAAEIYAKAFPEAVAEEEQSSEGS